MLTRDSILSASDLKRVAVAAPEWGGDVFVRSLTVAEKDACIQFFTDERERTGSAGKAMAALRVHMLTYAIVDAEGAQLFTVQDSAALSSKNAAVINRLYLAAEKLNADDPGAGDALVKK